MSAGGYSNEYRVTIDGFCPGIPDQPPEVMLLRINAIPTKISAHNYSTLDELPDKTYTAYYNELINITIKYCINESGTPLNKAHVAYQWLGLTPIDIFVDPVNKGFYTFTINTSDAQSTGLYIISITATYENYTTQSDFLVYLIILERKTTLNNQTTDIVYINTKILVQDPKDFIFTYRDNSTNEILGDLSTATYVWEELYENGTKVPGNFGSGNLIQNLNKTYTLDFNTELRQVGYYFLYVTLKKDNYIQKNALINLEIVLRPTLINGTTSILSISKAIEFRTAYNFTFEINNTLTHSRIGDLEHAFYYWYRTDSNGTILEGPSQNIDLIKDLNDLYILNFNTNLKSIGFYRIHVEFHKENYSSRSALINLEIIPKPTLINGTTSILYIIEAIEFGTAYNFTFEINDTSTHSRIGDLDHAFYYWYRTDSNSTIFEGPSQNIDLIKDLNDLYILDFNTNLKSIGFYRIHIEFHKENFTSRYAIIGLIIYPPPENPSPKIFGYDLMILLAVLIIITLAIKKKEFDLGLNKR
ncbi:MAG: hypothetical protein ACFFB6_04160 [Promethearchaeota archaeon]